MDHSESPGPGQPVVYQSPKRTMIASSTSHLLAAVQCQHFINWEGDSVKQGAYLLTKMISFISLYREPSGSKKVRIYQYNLLRIPNHFHVSDNLYYLDFILAYMLTFILLEPTKRRTKIMRILFSASWTETSSIITVSPPSLPPTRTFNNHQLVSQKWRG